MLIRGVFRDMAAAEDEHRRRLIDTYIAKSGDHIPVVRRQDVRGSAVRKTAW